MSRRSPATLRTRSRSRRTAAATTRLDTRTWTSSDNGHTWATAGVPLPTNFLALTVDIAPAATGAKGNVYASGFVVNSATDYVGTLVHTTDGGATWQSFTVPGSNNLSAPYIAAIDPNDANTLYVRFASDQGVLLVTHDGGQTFSTLYTATGQLLAFALSPDGKTILTGGEMDGILKASTSDYKFTKISSLHVRCLTWSDPSDVYACASEANDGFTVGKSVDQGMTFSAIHHLSCLEGPVGCAASSAVTTECAAGWATVSSTIQSDTCTSSSSSSSSSTTGGGTAMAKGGCAVAPGGTNGGSVAVLALGLATYVGRRKRRPSQA